MKRFIAGAKCPACHQEDTLYFKSEDQYETVYCSRCGYQEKRATELQTTDENNDESNPVKWH